LTSLPAFTSTKIAEPDQGLSACIIASLPQEKNRPLVSYRQAGDKYILLEYGDNILELSLRLRVYALMEYLKASPIKGVIELSPGVRSLQINYDSRVIHQKELIQQLIAIENLLADARDIKVPSRIVYLPMAFEDNTAWYFDIARIGQQILNRNQLLD